MIRLRVSSGFRVLFELSHDADGQKPVVHHASELMTNDVDRWIQNGLDEWVGDGIDAHPRHTDSTSIEFLPRLKEYLERQFDFTYELIHE